jgi:CxxC motif-containing protein
MSEQKVICIGCPLGCHVTLTIDSAGNISDITGNQCKEGKKHATAEYLHPERVLTATVLMEGMGNRLLPVRTDKPVPRSQLKEIMLAIAEIKVKPPVEVGQEIAHDILGTGANLVATSTF